MTKLPLLICIVCSLLVSCGPDEKGIFEERVVYTRSFSTGECKKYTHGESRWGNLYLKSVEVIDCNSIPKWHDYGTK